MGLRFNQAHYVTTNAGGRIWTVRGNRLTCIFQAVTAASSCAPDASVLKQGLPLVVGAVTGESKEAIPDSFLAIGIVPDGVRTVRLQPLGERARLVSVTRNAFSMRANSPIAFLGMAR